MTTSKQVRCHAPQLSNSSGEITAASKEKRVEFLGKPRKSNRAIVKCYIWSAFLPPTDRSRDISTISPSFHLYDLGRQIQTVSGARILEIQEPTRMDDGVGVKVEQVSEGIGSDLQGPGQTAHETLHNIERQFRKGTNFTKRRLVA
jgi:hypothetical protein